MGKRSAARGIGGLARRRAEIHERAHVRDELGASSRVCIAVDIREVGYVVLPFGFFFERIENCENSAIRVSGTLGFRRSFAIWESSH